MQAVIRAKVGALTTAPYVGGAGRMRSTRELVITGTPYVGAYRIMSEGVQILAVVHGARDWLGANP